MFTMIRDFCLCLCVYVKQERSSDRFLNELVKEGHRIPLTTFALLNAEYVSMFNGLVVCIFDWSSTSVSISRKQNVCLVNFRDLLQSVVYSLVIDIMENHRNTKPLNLILFSNSFFLRMCIIQFSSILVIILHVYPHLYAQEPFLSIVFMHARREFVWLLGWNLFF